MSPVWLVGRGLGGVWDKLGWLCRQGWTMKGPIGNVKALSLYYNSKGKPLTREGNVVTSAL